MLISQKIAGFSKGKADKLRKAMGKKKLDVLESLQKDFMSGGLSHGHPQATLEKIWKDWRAFAEYAFNKSHATCYAWVSLSQARGSACLGYVSAPDMPVVERMLQNPQIAALFPADFVWMWSVKPTELIKGGNYYELIAIRASARDGAGQNGSIITGPSWNGSPNGRSSA